VTDRRIRSEPERWRINLLIRAGLIALLAAAFIAAWMALPVRSWLELSVDWIRTLGRPGYLLFALGYAVASLLLAPGALLTVAAGLTFGWGPGLVVVAIGASISAALAFLLVRYAFRRHVWNLMRERPRLQALDRAVARQGWKAVLLLRLSGLLPFNLQSYLFGATAIGLWPYLAASLLGALPGAALLSYLGATAGNLAERGAQSPGQWALFGVGVLATLTAAFVVARAAKRHLAVRT
jgi:uncharacterized membrane protein YdjX (TVP38/TMEM64 family)